MNNSNLGLWNFLKSQFNSCILRSWYQNTCIHSKTVFPWLENNHALKYSSDNFQWINYLSKCIEKCQNYIVMCYFSPTTGRRLWKVEENTLLDKSLSFSKNRPWGRLFLVVFYVYISVDLSICPFSCIFFVRTLIGPQVTGSDHGLSYPLIPHTSYLNTPPPLHPPAPSAPLQGFPGVFLGFSLFFLSFLCGEKSP